jgi:hypothetical protein
LLKSKEVTRARNTCIMRSSVKCTPSLNVIGAIISRKIAWTGNVSSIKEGRNAYRVIASTMGVGRHAYRVIASSMGEGRVAKL